MEERKVQIADLYFRSNSIQFGDYYMSIHQDHPELPLSPYYLHYPKNGEPGSDLLPKLFRLIGEEFFELCENQNPPIRPIRITGVPDGALAIAAEHAEHYSKNPKKILTFKKIGQKGPTIFIGPLEEKGFNEGDDLLIDDDHTSGGRNKQLMRSAAISSGLVVKNMLTVVDRQQGGIENMERVGVRLLSIFTIDKLLEYEFGLGHISRDQIDEIEDYRAKNQYLML